MTQVTLKLMDPSPYLYTEGHKINGHRGKSSEKIVAIQDRSTRLSVQVSCNNSSRLIDKPIRHVWVRSFPRIKDPTGFLYCRDSFSLNDRI